VTAAEAKPAHVRVADVRGGVRLATTATAGLADLVEAMHRSIAHPLEAGAVAEPGRTRGVTGLVYRTVRGVTRLVGGSLDAVLGLLGPAIGARPSSSERDAVIAALNGVLGDHLAASGNPLATPMLLRGAGRVLTLQRRALANAFPMPGHKLLVLVHGLCMDDRCWNRAGHDHGEVLARKLGYTPLYLRYNSGQHVSTNGRAFSALLDELVAGWPHRIDELTIVGHSMGGLVARSACHYGAADGHRWMQALRSLVFIGTPHHGAPLERGGHWVDLILGATPFAKPFARLGKLRSAGITDLRSGSVIDDDWQGRDRFAPKHDAAAPRAIVPLPERVKCFAIAGTTGKRAGDLRDRLLGDGLVPVASALGRDANAAPSLRIPTRRQWITYDTGHMALLDSATVSDRLVRWLAPASK
jgi:pimeloyl-ACP methyl ester carboxylesterase